MKFVFTFCPFFNLRLGHRLKTNRAIFGFKLETIITTTTTNRQDNKGNHDQEVLRGGGGTDKRNDSHGALREVVGILLIDGNKPQLGPEI